MSQEFRERLARRLAWQRAAHDPVRDPRNLLPQLSMLRQWQSKRLAESFADFLADPKMRPAAEFFLSDLYGDKDFSARDRDAARILPLMSRLLPDTLLRAATEAIELAVVSHVLDLRVAAALARRSKPLAPITTADYARAYRAGRYRLLRRHQIALVLKVGHALDLAVQKHGVYKLLRASLERGFTAFDALGGADHFLSAVSSRELAVSERLFGGHPDPFAQPNSS